MAGFFVARTSILAHSLQEDDSAAWTACLHP